MQPLRGRTRDHYARNRTAKPSTSATSAMAISRARMVNRHRIQEAAEIAAIVEAKNQLGDDARNRPFGNNLARKPLRADSPSLNVTRRFGSGDDDPRELRHDSDSQKFPMYINTTTPLADSKR